MHRRRWVERRSILTVAACLVTPAIGAGQPGDLAADLAKLNVRHRTEHYAIAGTAGDARLAEYGRCLEYIHHEYARGFSELLATPPDKPSRSGPSKGKRPTRKPDDREGSSTPPGEPAGDGASGIDARPDRPPVVRLPGEDGRRFPVIVFAKADEYRDFGRKYFGGGMEHTAGGYIPGLGLLVIRDEPNSSETYGILFHEAFHQFADRYVPAIPMWLNEGLATYYGHARVTPSGLKFDRPAAGHFALVRRAESARALISLGELMRYDRDRFYQADRMELCYAQSYTLSAYILQDEAGAGHLRGFLKQLAAAKTTDDVERITGQFFDGKRLEKMTGEWLAFCQRN